MIKRFLKNVASVLMLVSFAAVAQAATLPKAIVANVAKIGTTDYATLLQAFAAADRDCRTDCRKNRNTADDIAAVAAYTPPDGRAYTPRNRSLADCGLRR